MNTILLFRQEGERLRLLLFVYAFEQKGNLPSDFGLRIVFFLDCFSLFQRDVYMFS